MLVFPVFLQTLNSIPDQDTFYDITDQLEVQGMEQVTQKLTSRSGSDLDLMEQIRIYEVSPYLMKFDDDDDAKPIFSHLPGL